MMTQSQLFFIFFLAAIHQVVLALQRKGFGELAELGRVAKLEAVQAEALGELENRSMWGRNKDGRHLETEKSVRVSKSPLLP